MFRSKIPAFLLLVSFCALPLSACSSSKAEVQHQMPAPEVAVARVVSKQIEDFSDFSGRLEAVNSVELHPQVEGYVESVRFTEGSRVKKGDLLFSIDSRKFQRQVTRLEAEQRRAQSELTLASADRDRSAKLVQTGAVAPVELERNAAREAAAKAALDSTKATLALARLDVEYAAVRAPIEGRVSRALVTAGNLVTPATALTSLVSDGAVYVYFDVDEATYLSIGRDPKGEGVVKIGLIDEQGFPREGTLDFFDNRVDPRTGTIRARARIDNSDGRMVPGLFARVRLFGGGSTAALLVDEKAIMTDQDRRYVYVLGEGNRAQRKDVVLGRVSDGLREIKSGLGAADRVIVHGTQKVFFPGAPVNPKEIAMGAPPPAPSGPPGH